MRLSIVVSTQPASFSALAYQGRLEETIAKVGNLGYDGVELAVRDPGQLLLEPLNRILLTHGLTVPAIGTGQAFGEEGLSWTHEDNGIRRRAVERMLAQVRLADRLKAVVIVGLIRGNSAVRTGLERAQAWFAGALAECACSNPNVKLAVEPINRYECDFLNTVESVLRFLDRVKLDNVGLLADTFHMNIEEPSIVAGLVQAKDRLFHVHVADSNRYYPGAGHLDFKEIVGTLDSIGYNGFLSAEILPKPDPDSAAARTIENLSRWVH
jgi:sugar phosphate isomerase/epimerase